MCLEHVLIFNVDNVECPVVDCSRWPVQPQNAPLLTGSLIIGSSKRLPTVYQLMYTAAYYKALARESVGPWNGPSANSKFLSVPASNKSQRIEQTVPQPSLFWFAKVSKRKNNYVAVYCTSSFSLKNSAPSAKSLMKTCTVYTDSL